MTGQFWSEDRDATLRRLIIQGKSYSEAGHVLGATRNAVSGRCFRLGLKRA